MATRYVAAELGKLMDVADTMVERNGKEPETVLSQPLNGT